MTARPFARLIARVVPRLAPRASLAQVLLDFPLAELVPYIDWNPLFAVWQLRGRYPNRGYPKIFNDEAVGAEATKLYNDAVALMQHFIDNKLLTARAVVGIYPANSVGDDIEVYKDESRTELAGTFFTLRQQEEREDDSYLALSDFVAPKDSGVKDYIGAFAVSCGFGTEELCEKYKAEHNDYNVIMTEAIADRLAEAFAELLHAKMRKELWGYAPNEDITPDDMLKVRAAVASPLLPLRLAAPCRGRACVSPLSFLSRLLA